VNPCSIFPFRKHQHVRPNFSNLHLLVAIRSRPSRVSSQTILYSRGLISALEETQYTSLLSVTAAKQKQFEQLPPHNKREAFTDKKRRKSIWPTYRLRLADMSTITRTMTTSSPAETITQLTFVTLSHLPTDASGYPTLVTYISNPSPTSAPQPINYVDNSKDLSQSSLIGIIVASIVAFIVVALCIYACFSNGMRRRGRDDETQSTRTRWYWGASARETEEREREQPIWVEMIGGYFAPGRKERMREAWIGGGRDVKNGGGQAAGSPNAVPAATHVAFRYA